DGSGFIILGYFNGYIEAGKFCYSSDFYGGSTGGLDGPIGSPVGFSNINYPGITGATLDYPWLLDSYSGETGSPYFPNGYILPDGDWNSIFLMEISNNRGDCTSFGEVDFSNDANIIKYDLKNFRHFPLGKNISPPENLKLSVSYNKI